MKNDSTRLQIKKIRVVIKWFWLQMWSSAPSEEHRSGRVRSRKPASLIWQVYNKPSRPPSAVYNLAPSSTAEAAASRPSPSPFWPLQTERARKKYKTETETIKKGMVCSLQHSPLTVFGIKVDVARRVFLRRHPGPHKSNSCLLTTFISHQAMARIIKSSSLDVHSVTVSRQ